MSDIKGLADLRPGDIMFGPIGGLVGLGVGLGQLALGEAFHVGRLSIRHVGIVVEDFRPPITPQPGFPDGRGSRGPRLVQAMPHGAEEIEMSEATHWTDRHAYVRILQDYPGQAVDAAGVARLMVSEGVSYSFASYAALAAWKYGIKARKLEAWIDRRRPPIMVDLPAGRGLQPAQIRLPVEAICSVLVDQCWSLAGKRVMQGVAHQAVTPGAMARQLWQRRGAIWGGPGLL